LPRPVHVAVLAMPSGETNRERAAVR
jgi:hypothetical protein